MVGLVRERHRDLIKRFDSILIRQAMKHGII